MSILLNGVPAVYTYLIPTANSQVVTVNENALLPITLTGTDYGIGDVLTLIIVSAPAHGTVQPVSGMLNGSAPNVTYVPNSNQHQTDSFGFTVSFAGNTSEPGTVIITVKDINVPMAFGKSVSLNENSSLGITLTGADSDISDVLTFTVVTQPRHGHMSGTAPKLTYTPTAD